MSLYNKCESKISEIAYELIKKYPDSYLEDLIYDPVVKEYPGEVEYNSIYLTTEDEDNIEIISGVYWDEIDRLYSHVYEYVERIKTEDADRNKSKLIY